MRAILDDNVQGNVEAATFNNKAECLSLAADVAAARLIGRRREQQKPKPWMASHLLSESMRIRRLSVCV